MQPGKFLSLNGKMVESRYPVLSADNRSFRYGDGFFETIRWEGNTAFLWEYHVKRFFSTLDGLAFVTPQWWDEAFLRSSIQALVVKNKHERQARIRCTVYRGEGGIYDANTNTPQLIIQSWPLEGGLFDLNSNGLDINIFSNAIKTADGYSAYKTNSALPYIMAAQFAKANRYNDAILRNQWGRVADTTIANIFIIHDNKIITPPLSEGCVNGVFRKFLLETLDKIGFQAQEFAVSEDILKNANQVFLTNAIKGIRWVNSIGSTHYSNQLIGQLVQEIRKFNQ
ncbi:MAG: aminotransferase class IV [Sediminibacterium sp.]|jgi:branched-chain amino acid aminotransferase|nr:aminotransferase class IV [Chitinophagaceae bacterium]